MNYHKDFTYFSKSFLVAFLKSPLNAKILMESEHQDTPAMNFGRAYHLAVEGKEVSFYDINDRPNLKYGMSAKANKEWLSELHEENETIVSSDELQQIADMIAVLKENEVYQKINNFKPKQEEPFKADVKGFPVKCKPDAICEESALIVDWKTCPDVEDRTIYSNIYKYHYDMQAALYCDILHELTGVKHNFLFMFQEKQSPYDVLPVLIRHNSEAYSKGQEKWIKCAKMAKTAFETNVWPGASSKFDNGILELN